MEGSTDDILKWFRVDNLEPVLRYGYPSRVDDEILELNADYPEDRGEAMKVFDELRSNLGHHLDDNKIVIGYRRKDNNEMVYVGWKDSLRHIGPRAHNRDGAEPSRPWDI